MIEVRNLTKIYKLYNSSSDRLKEALNPFKKKYHKDFFALKEISFSIKKGEVVGILGKNGSGKSTTLKIISGVLTQSSGSCVVNGKITALLELGAGLNPELTGIENIYLSGSIMGYTQAQIENKLDEILSFAELDEFIYQPIKTYSSGMKARLGFSIAINVEPEILIVDEALSVGDAAFQRKCYSKIEHLCKDNGVTVLFVSHSSSVIKQLCTRAIMLHDGEKVIEGSAKEVVNMYDKFMGSTDLSKAEIQKEFQLLSKKQTIIEKNKLKAANFNANMVSKSKTAYKQNGAKIFDVKVLDENNQECNILDFDEEYFFSYKVEFLESLQNIKLAMFIKTTTGIEISGKGMPLNEKNILEVKSGDVFHIKWKFRNRFNEGFYFFNCAVNSSNYGEKTVHHRIIDAYMIKSVKDEHNHAHGIIDIGLELDIQKVTV
jgi:lipopolysaccharide transport system ATP-binding protein